MIDSSLGETGYKTRLRPCSYRLQRDDCEKGISNNSEEREKERKEKKEEMDTIEETPGRH